MQYGLCWLAILLLPFTFCFAQSTDIATSVDGRSILANTLSALAVATPSDCTANGAAELESGGRKESGTIRVLARGTGESSQEIQTDASHFQTVYSDGLARELSSKLSSVERSLTSQSVIFPLPVLASMVNDADTSIVVMGRESAGGFLLIHLRAKKLYSNTPKSQHLTAVSQKDIWLDSTTLLPRRISFEQRDGTGGYPGVQVDYFFSDYRNVQGISFPFLVLQSLNGTPWGTFRFQSVAFNTGLTSSSFNVQ